MKITISVPPAIYELAAQEAVRRKIAREPKSSVSGVIQDCIEEKLRAVMRRQK